MSYSLEDFFEEKLLPELKQLFSSKQEAIFRDIGGKNWEGVINGIGSSDQDQHRRKLGEAKPEVTKDSIAQNRFGQYRNY